MSETGSAERSMKAVGILNDTWKNFLARNVGIVSMTLSGRIIMKGRNRIDYYDKRLEKIHNGRSNARSVTRGAQAMN